MFEVPDIVKDKINKFLKLMEKDNIQIQKAILFGSYATGTYNKPELRIRVHNTSPAINGTPSLRGNQD